jgi:hypothetical protein
VTGNQGGNESSASLSETGSTEAAQPSAPTEQPKAAAAADSQKKKSLLETGSTEAAQPSAPTEQPKAAAAADSQKKKSLLAAFSTKTKKTIKKDVSLLYILPPLATHSHAFICISMSLTRVSRRLATLAERRRKNWRTW